MKKMEEEGEGMNKTKLWAIQGSNLAKMNSTSLHPTPWSCTAAHSHLLVGQSSIKAKDRPYSSPLGLEKAANISRPVHPGWL